MKSRKILLQNKAFSLIELSIVLIIIGLLIAGIVGGKKLISVADLSKARALTNSSPVAGTEDLAMWLESTSKKSFDSAQPSDGDAVATWKDINPQTNNKVNAIQINSFLRPAYRLDGINGLPTVTYSASSMSLNYNAPIPNNSKYTVFVVAQLPNSSSSTRIMRPSSSDPNSGFSLGYDSNSISWRHDHNLFNHIVNPAISFSSPTNIIHSIVNSGSEGGFLYINGEEVASVASAPLITDATLLGIITSFNNTEIMKVGEIIIFTRALNSFERKEIEKYLSKKWKIELVN